MKGITGGIENLMRVTRRAARWLLVLGLAGCSDVLEIPDSSCDARFDISCACAEGQNPCDCYCDLVAANCTGVNSVYLSREDCGAMCPAFEDSLVFSEEALRCRINFAAQAGTSSRPEQVRDLCSAAGPSGRAQSGAFVCDVDSCNPYCGFVGKFCSEEILGEAVEGAFPNSFTCIDDCQTRREQSAAYDNRDYRVRAAGDNLQCRLYHVTNSALAHSQNDLAEAARHCTHALGAPPCSAEAATGAGDDHQH